MAGATAASPPLPPTTEPLGAYLADAAQRTVLFWDVLRRRGDQYLEQMAKEAPNVLLFEHDVILDGRSLPRPCNYALVRITPPPGAVIGAAKRPFVVVDPRAGHGPGIGGFKADSEIGVALAAGHPCYFIGFLPTPVAGQTLEDVLAAIAAFVERVAALHPGAEGKPVVIGNCQAGWAVLMVAATRPELFGPIIAAGAPLSYWAGARGRDPMRDTGGLVGGSWVTAFLGDLGDGVFDGAMLVQNFERLDPANTFWSKPYNLYAKVDTEAPRYLGFERWWGGHVLLNAEEMQFIVDQLFVGNRLATAEIVTRDGVRIDLRNVTAPIVCFCSRGDNITPPPQALGWILDLYDSVEAIRANGQTIVYCVHDHVGHLGIFVSGSVAKKEHSEFASNIDLIDCLPPGLFEAVLVPAAADADGLVVGGYVARFEARTLDDLRRLGGNDLEDERAFAAMARLSEVNLGLYRMLWRPIVRMLASPASADLARRLHPARLPFTLLSSRNPWLQALAGTAEAVRASRRPTAADNPFLAAQELWSRQVIALLDAYRDWRDRSEEALFFAAFGNPLLQALLGLRAHDAIPRPRPGREPEEIAFVREELASLRAGMGEGGTREALIRGLIYVGLAEGRIDERGFNLLTRVRDEHARDLDLATFKALFRRQFLTVLLDPDAAVAALPDLLSAGDGRKVGEAATLLERVATASGPLGAAARDRLAQVKRLFDRAAAAA